MPVYIDGLDRLRHKMKNLDDLERRAVAAEFKESAETILAGAKRNAPRRTGSYAESLKREEQDDNVGQVVGTNDFRAKWLEFGTVKASAHPHLFPAFEEERPKLVRNLVRALDRAHKRLR